MSKEKIEKIKMYPKQRVTEKQLANLRPPFGPDQDREAARINGRKAGIASGESRRRRRRMTEAAKWLLGSNDVVSDEDILNKLRELGVEDVATNAEALMLVALRKASKGDVEALKFVRDTAGESPSNRVELSGDVDRPVATLDLRNLSEDELLRMAEARSGADEAPESEE